MHNLIRGDTPAIGSNQPALRWINQGNTTRTSRTRAELEHKAAADRNRTASAFPKTCPSPRRVRACAAVRALLNTHPRYVHMDNCLAVLGYSQSCLLASSCPQISPQFSVDRFPSTLIVAIFTNICR